MKSEKAIKAGQFLVCLFRGKLQWHLSEWSSCAFAKPFLIAYLSQLQEEVWLCAQQQLLQLMGLARHVRCASWNAFFMFAPCTSCMYRCLEKRRQISSKMFDCEFTAITKGMLQLYKTFPISSEWQADTNANLIPWSVSDPRSSKSLFSLILSPIPEGPFSNYK